MQKNILFQLAVILAVTYAGNFISEYISIPLPGVVIGLVLLFAALYIKVIKLDHVENAANALLTNMAFLFIPAGVAIIDSLHVLSTYWWKLLIVILLSTIVTMVVTGVVVQRSIYYMRKRRLK